MDGDTHPTAQEQLFMPKIATGKKIEKAADDHYDCRRQRRILQLTKNSRYAVDVRHGSAFLPRKIFSFTLPDLVVG
jgi:hypothetical protein